MRSRHPSSPNVFTLERLSCLRSPIKPIAWGRVSFCEHFFNSNEGRFKRRVIRGENRHFPKFVVLKHCFFYKKNRNLQTASDTPSPSLDGSLFQPYYLNMAHGGGGGNIKHT